MANHSIGDPSARPSDEFVPEVDRGPLPGMRTSRLVAGAVLAPAVLVAVPLSDSVRRLVYLCALALVWSLIVNAVLHERAPRRWTGIAIGTGLMVLGEAAHVLFVVSGRLAFLRGGDAL